MKALGFSLILILIVSSCTYNDTASLTELFDEAATKTWLLYERGYSPGAGYITDPVPSEPAQTLTLRPNHLMDSNIAGLGNFKHYRVVDDPQSENDILAFFENDPGSNNVDISTLQHSYNLIITDTNIKLTFRHCIEGCHMSFRPITSQEK